MTYRELEKAFPKELQGFFGVFTDENGLKKTKDRCPSNKFYNEYPHKLTDGTDVYVCTRWGKNIQDLSACPPREAKEGLT